ncbi:MAG: N-acetylmuramoyl-L-alanine amidase [Elusimicrobiaceae bacterium]
MMKKAVAGLVLLSVLLAGTLCANARQEASRAVPDMIQFAESGDYKDSVDSLDKDGRLYLHARKVLELFGGTIYWNPKSGALSGNIRKVKVSFTVGSDTAVLAGQPVRLSDKTVKYGEKAYVPVDFFTSDAFGAAVGRDIAYNQTAHSLDVEKIFNVGEMDYFSYGAATRVSFELRGVSKYSSLEKGPRHVQIVIEDALAKVSEKENFDDGLVKSVSVAGLNGDVVIDAYLGERGDVWNVSREQDTLILAVTRKDAPAQDGVAAATASVLAPPLAPAIVQEDRISIPDIISPMRTGRKLVVIDPGHGGKDPGGHKRKGLAEKSLNIRMAEELAGLLKEDGGFDVLVTRTSDYFIPLSERSRLANDSHADIFVSIHANAHPRKHEKGFEIYFMSERASDPWAASVAAKENSVQELEDDWGADPAELLLHSMARNEYMNEAAQLAGLVANHVGARTPFKNRGVKQAAFYVLRGTYTPAVLVEMGFMTNADDCKNLNDEKVRAKMARGIYDGIVDYAKLKGWK